MIIMTDCMNLRGLKLSESSVQGKKNSPKL